jgi:hypothetical protein
MSKYKDITMTRLRHLTAGCIIMLCMLATAFSSKAQSVYMGRFSISDVSFVHAGNILYVHMRVSYMSGAVKSNESLTFTPVFKSDNNIFRLPPSVIYGETLERTEHRIDILQHRIRQNAAKVIHGNTKGVRYFIYEASARYAGWMKKGYLYIDNETCDCNGHRARTYEDRLMASLPIKTSSGEMDNDSDSNENANPSQTISYRDISTWVRFLPPPQEDYRDFTRTGVITLTGKDSIGKANGKSRNEYICEQLNGRIKSVSEQYGTALAGVAVTVYGCPRGNFEKSMKTGMKQALSLKRYLMNNLPSNKDEINVGWISEDWDSIATIAAKSGMLLSNAVTDIIHSVKITEGREDAIKKLNNSLPYYYMRTNIFPEVCRVKYTLSFSHKDVSLETAKEMLKRSPGNMTLKELYSVADSYGVGSREFNDITDLSACLFPDSPEANINAAAVAMLKGETKQARKYLTRWQADPRAFENMGVLNMLEGNRTKAGFYLELARMAGVPQAMAVINALNAEQLVSKQ